MQLSVTHLHVHVCVHVHCDNILLHSAKSRYGDSHHVECITQTIHTILLQYDGAKFKLVNSTPK